MQDHAGSPGAWRCLGVASVLLFLTPAAAAPAEPDPAATRRAAAVVAQLGGRVWVHPADGSEPSPVELLQGLFVGDSLRSEEGAWARIWIAGGLIVTVRGGFEIDEDLAADPDLGAGEVQRLSENNLTLLDNGMRILSDPAGRRLVGGMRGGGESPAEDRDGGSRPLSPRRELVLESRPTFYWAGAAGKVRVVVADREEILWRSGPLPGSVARYPADAPPLRPGRIYDWWLQDPDEGARLSAPVPFQIASARQIEEATAFESEMQELASAADTGPLATLLRCAYYEELEAWSRVLRAASRLVGAPGGDDRVAQTRTNARRSMGLSEPSVEKLLELSRG